MSIREFMRGSPDQMLFVNELLKAGTARGEAAPSVANKRVSIYDRIREGRRKLENESWGAGLHVTRAEELEREADGMVKRHQLKRKREALREAQEARAEAAELEAGTRLRSFLEEAKPYVQEFQKQQFCRQQPAGADAALGFAPPREAGVLEDFIVRVEGGVPKLDIQNADNCGACKEPMQLHPSLSLLVCPRCGTTRPFLDATSSLLGYAEDSNYEFCSFSYKRINHFSEWLASIQAKETLEIPLEKLELVMDRLLTERVSPGAEVTVHRVREALKKLKLRKYYEHAPLITYKITGRTPPRMTPEMEERIKVYFLAAAASFSRNCPPTKRNLSSYGILLYKLCELLGYTEFLSCFTLLKGRDKVARMESTWGKICEDLDWEFVPFPT